MKREILELNVTILREKISSKYAVLKIAAKKWQETEVNVKSNKWWTFLGDDLLTAFPIALTLGNLFSHSAYLHCFDDCFWKKASELRSHQKRKSRQNKPIALTIANLLWQRAEIIKTMGKEVKKIIGFVSKSFAEVRWPSRLRRHYLAELVRYCFEACRRNSLFIAIQRISTSGLKNNYSYSLWDWKCRVEGNV